MRRFLAALLSITLVLQMVIFFTLAAGAEPQRHYAGIGDYTVSLQADPVTNTAPAEFGTAAANGKVWTDKSVTVKQNRFEVTLSALAQEYISEDKSNTTSSVSADVVMILDMSGSMQQNKITLHNESMTRTKAMIKAVNEALEIVMGANENNRVLIYTYQSDNTGKTPKVSQLLPLGHYSNSSWNNEEVFSGNSGKYFNYTSRFSSDSIQSSSNLKKDDVAFAQTSVSTSNGTCTQHGILTGVQALVTAIGQEEKTVDRKPYIMLFTDGAPGNATKQWYNPSSSSCDFSHENSGSTTISALSILSAAYMKNALDTAYRTYNGKNVGIEWFNIGLGVGDSELGTFFLQPTTLATGTSNNATSMRSEIATYTSGQYAAYADYANQYAYTVDAYIVDSGDDLEDAFTELAGRIEEETKTITSPIISVEDAASDLTFTDVIGAGMDVSNICLHPDGDTAIYGNISGGAYSFTGYDITATVTTDEYNRTVVQWNIPANELAIFAFDDRDDPTNGNYIAAEPVRLTYDVQVADPAGYEGTILYSNASAKAEYKIPGDNTYYFEENGTLKSDRFAAQDKTQNLTGLTGYVATYDVDQTQNGTAVTVALGNNGKITPAILLEKSAEDARAEAGKPVAFTLSVTNKGQTDLSNVVVTDTIPAGMTYQENTAQNATVAASGAVLTFTIPSISAGQSVLVTYDVMLSADVATGDTFTNTAAVTRVNQVDVYGPAETSTTVIAYHTYQVRYEWTGAIPTGLIPPVDSNRYTTGAYYPLDTSYTAQTKLENKDNYGNVTERWTFSGWDDPNSGLMGEADVTIRGVWRHETFTYPAHRVIYTWSGDIPPGKTVPSDGNSYIQNQPYTVDSTYTAATVIETRDAYGNVSGRYTFSGWADPNGGVMGNADVTIPGIWNYEPVEVPTYRVFYTWTGTIPEGHVLPVDTNTYAPNQAYTVDTTYTTPTVIFTYDEFGNINGRYTFLGWTDPNNGIMGNADVTISGVWQYQSMEVSAHRVIYIWTGDIPAGVTLPTDGNAYVKNQFYSVDTTYTASIVIPTYDSYGNVNGRYTFSGWTDPNNGVMGEEDVVVRGVWDHETITVERHKVLYVWTGTVPAGLQPPVDSNSYLPNQPYTVDDTYTAATERLTYDAYGNLIGRYTFSGWADPNSGLMGEADVTIRGVWRHETFTYPAHRVIYTWTGTIPPGKALPSDGNSYIQNQPYTVDSTYTAATMIETRDAYGNVNGRYTFSGWTDPNSGVMGSADVTIRGVWKYEPVDVPTYRVVYTWTGTIPEGRVPPVDTNTYAPNQPYNVNSTYSTSTVIFTYDAYGNINGRYTFSGWTDPNSGIMGNADVTIRGVWQYQTIEVPAHRVIYTWSGEVPAGETLPTDGNAYVKNQFYSVDTTYTASIVIPTYDSYGNVNGRHTFSGWTDPNNGVMGEEDVVVRGVWDYETITVEKHKVLYVWTGTIPAGLQPPVDSNSYLPNQPYTVNDTYTAATERLTYDAYGNLIGRYTFSGWTDPNDGLMGNEDVTVRGVWSFEDYTVPNHQVIYEWTGELPPDEVLPTDENTYVKNQPYSVDGEYTAATVIPTFDAYGNLTGRYTFSGWEDPNSGIMGDEDVTVRGIWEYKPVTVPAYRVIYVWTGTVPPEVELPTDENTYVKNQPYTVDITYTAATEIFSFAKTRTAETIEGKYTFSGWDDPNNGIMGEDDVIIVGVWKFETIEQPPEPIPEPEPESPKTGEFWTMERLFTLMSMSVTGMILVNILCAKKKEEA